MSRLTHPREQQGRSQTAGNGKGQAQHQEERIAEILPKLGMRKELNEIAETDEVQRFVPVLVVSQKIPIRELHAETHDQRHQNEGDESEDVWQ